AARGRGSRWTSSSRTERSTAVWRSDGEAPRLGAPFGVLERYLKLPAAREGPRRGAGRPSLLVDDAVRGYWTLPRGQVREWALPDALDLVTEPIAAPEAAGDPAAFRLGARRCVVYRDRAGALRLCSRGERWSAGTLGDAPPAAGDPRALWSGPEAWIFYRGRDRRLHALHGGERGWTHDSREAPGGDPAAWLSRQGPCSVHRSEPGGNLAITTWGERPVETELRAAPPASSAPSAFRAGDRDCIAYGGAGGRLHLLERGESGWSHADLHALAPGAPLAASAPCAFGDSACAHVVYRSGDNHLHALTRLGGRWRHTDLIAAAGVSGAARPAGDPAGTSAGGAARVFYVGEDGALHALALGGMP
ncbi:MAG TPA: hypothetical protein VFP52_00205, partial [Myxococcales bacterium]|nr:hypothetical protein [Myxococcales bacterium]